MKSKFSLYVCMFLLLSSNKSAENVLPEPPIKITSEVLKSEVSTNECIAAMNKALNENSKTKQALQIEKQNAIEALK